MSDFETAHQGQEPQVNEQIETTPVEPQSTPQENVFTVKYNKEEVQVPYEQAPDYIQKGLNYEKVQTRATEYEQNLNRIAQLSGYQTHDELMQAIAEAEQQRERQQYEEAGIDPDTFNQLLENHPDIQFAREQRAKQEADEKFNQQVSELFSEFPDLKPEQIQPEVLEMNKSQGIPLLDAYLRVNFKSLAKQKEQEVISKIQQNQLSSAGSLSGGDVSHNTSISKMSSADFKTLQERVLRGEKVQF